MTLQAIAAGVPVYPEAHPKLSKGIIVPGSTDIVLPLPSISISILLRFIDPTGSDVEPLPYTYSPILVGSLHVI